MNRRIRGSRGLKPGPPVYRAASLGWVLVAVLMAGGCSGAGDQPAAGGATAPPATAPPTTTTPPTTAPATSEPSGSATTARPPAPVRYRFPVTGCQARYGTSHHDYPAADMFTARGCTVVAPVDGRDDEVARTDNWTPASDRGADRGGRSVSLVGVDGVR